MTQQTVKPARWVCLECHYIYDPEKGDKSQGIASRSSLRKTSGYMALPAVQSAPKCKKGVFKKLDD